MVSWVTQAPRCARTALGLGAIAIAMSGAACASSRATRKPAEPKVDARVIAPADQPASAPEPAPPPSAVPAAVRIKGLTGTLNTDDVHQTMEARQPELDACILASRRRLRLVSGTIRFTFEVDAEGAVEDVHAIESTIGHFALESCILRVLSETVFPKPDGSASARFDWGLTVEPASARGPEVIGPEALDKVLGKHGAAVREGCETKRRERFRVTAYINRRGKVISAGAVAEPASAREKVECVLDGIKKLKMPKPKRDAKVAFLLK